MIDWMVEVEDVDIVRPVSVHALAYRAGGGMKGERGFRPLRVQSEDGARL